jgi:hypothetical protein
MQFGKSLAKRDETQSFAATRAAQQVDDFMTDGGWFADPIRPT